THICNTATKLHKQGHLAVTTVLPSFASSCHDHLLAMSTPLPDALSESLSMPAYANPAPANSAVVVPSIVAPCDQGLSMSLENQTVIIIPKTQNQLNL
ncbi:hypothetical protein HK100_001599, partial [Physocladia obscura]